MRTHSVVAPFTPEDRERLRAELVAEAGRDPRIVAAAATGSAATGQLDRWSDIDLAFAVAGGVDVGPLAADWTDRMYRDRGAVHHVDLARGGVLFRVFLLADTLQIDLAFWPAAEFGAVGPAFKLLFGTADAKPAWPGPTAEELVGMGWLYALHARSSIERGLLWQAEYMVSAVRDQVVALACLRHGLPAVYARGTDRLPAGALAGLDAGLVRSLDQAELRRAFRVVCLALVAEISHPNVGMSARLAGVVGSLAEPPVA
jgi:predicted nucleotidyltransferase